MTGLIKINGVLYCPDQKNCGCEYPDISSIKPTHYKPVYEGHPYKDVPGLLLSKYKTYKVRYLQNLEGWQGCKFNANTEDCIRGVNDGKYIRCVGGQGYPIEAFQIGVDVEVL